MIPLLVIMECRVHSKIEWNDVQVKEKKITSIYFNTNYRTEMKLVPIITDYSLLQFDALKFFLGVRSHGRSQLNLNFSM